MADTFHDRRERIFMNKQIIISIGREYGSGGHVIAEMIAKHYNIPLYDRNILDELPRKLEILTMSIRNTTKSQQILLSPERYSDSQTP